MVDKLIEDINGVMSPILKRLRLFAARFFAFRSFTVESTGRSYRFVDISVLERVQLCKIESMPYVVRVLVESAFRHYLQGDISADEALGIIDWGKSDAVVSEIPVYATRILGQDFTYGPLNCDIAELREELAARGLDPALVNPRIQTDVVIDHSLIVEHSGASDSEQRNIDIEFQRNRERYRLFKWAAGSVKNLRVFPKQGICHQVNMEYLAEVIYQEKKLSADGSLGRPTGLVFPDICIGIDSHTPMVNSLGVLSFGVGGIEAMVGMFGEPLPVVVPEVIGIRLTGRLPSFGVLATDVALAVTQLCRKIDVNGKFVEFFGPGLSQLTAADRATIANMAPEQGSTVSYFPIDSAVLDYLTTTARSEEQIVLVDAYARAAHLFRGESGNNIRYSRVIELDLSKVTPSAAGPKRPQDRQIIYALGENFQEGLTKLPDEKQGLGVHPSQFEKLLTVTLNEKSWYLRHGFIALAAITSCTNTSNPAAMIAAGLVAKKAAARGLHVPPYVKTSFAPGSRAVPKYLEQAGLLKALEDVGFFLTGRDCSVCIGNSGPLVPEISEIITQHNMVATSVLSGNRNFTYRIHPQIEGNYLMSPPWVVIFALVGTVVVNTETQPIGFSSEGVPVYLDELWPSKEEIDEVMARVITREIFHEVYHEEHELPPQWEEIEIEESLLFPWDDASTYVRRPPFLREKSDVRDRISIRNAQVLGVFGNSVTTDHISPAGFIASTSDSAQYLRERGVAPGDFNSYGARRANYEVMVRGTFANRGVRNALAGGQSGNVTLHHPTNQLMSFYQASLLYKQENVPLVIFARRGWGSGSSRDWAAKGLERLGVQAVIFESCERIHRSNLVGMGILPLQFREGQSYETLGLDGSELVSIEFPSLPQPRQLVQVIAYNRNGAEKVRFEVVCRIDTPREVEYYRYGGILPWALQRFIAASKA